MAKVKTTNSRESIRKIKLLEILTKKEMCATKIIPTPDGFVVNTDGEADLDITFNTRTDEQLKQEFTPQIPLELKANRSVLAFRTDNYVFNYTEEEIKNEIETKNQWMGNIVQINKFPINMITITFNETEKATKVTEREILAFPVSIPKHERKISSTTFKYAIDATRWKNITPKIAYNTIYTKYVPNTGRKDTTKKNANQRIRMPQLQWKPPTSLNEMPQKKKK